MPPFPAEDELGVLSQRVQASDTRDHASGSGSARGRTALADLSSTARPLDADAAMLRIVVEHAPPR
jgi:hypothetical protein